MNTKTQIHPISDVPAECKLGRYRVRFVEWVLYEHIIEAPDGDSAIVKVQNLLANDGPEDMRIRDNGTEEWEAEPAH
jgi:hypothetical protein